MYAVEPPIPRIPQALLAFVAGYVDSCTFLALFGLYVAQVTGSFVVVGTELVADSAGLAVHVLAVPVFALAAVLTALVVARAGRNRTAVVWTLILENLLLIAFFAAVLLQRPASGPDAPAVLLASMFGLAAMGVQSASVRMLSGGGGSTNVMTTNTTQAAIDATEWALAWCARRRAPHDAGARDRVILARSRCGGLLLLIGSFLAGTILGAAAYAIFGVRCLLAPIALLIALTGWAIWTRQREQA
jgi:uncharacterized membrane protein YoaK (UPF0700 family)